jgi:hypothetical protein
MKTYTEKKTFTDSNELETFLKECEANKTKIRVRGRLNVEVQKQMNSEYHIVRNDIFEQLTNIGLDCYNMGWHGCYNEAKARNLPGFSRLVELTPFCSTCYNDFDKTYIQLFRKLNLNVKWEVYVYPKKDKKKA